MKRKDYERPRMTVVPLQPRTAVLQLEGIRSGYGKSNTGVDPNEVDENGIWTWD